MSSFKVTGQIPLKGEIEISGRKNAALKLIAASILNTGKTTLHRIPDIGDVRMMLQIMEKLGAKIEGSLPDQITIDTSEIHTYEIPTDLGHQFRGSLILVGPLLARFGKAIFPHPGGCLIGKRTIEPHLKAFELLGAKIELIEDQYHLESDELLGADIYLKERSVTGTENTLMAAVLAKGHTIIRNCAEETHIKLLAESLIKMGYQISGVGTSTINIIGSEHIQNINVEFYNIADEIEIGTFAVASVITHGNIKMLKVGPKEDLLPIISRLDDQNIQYIYNSNDQSLEILESNNVKAVDLKINTWPGFPTDLLSPFTVLATQVKGNSLLHDWMFEGRMYFVSSLQTMGAKIVVCDPHRVIVTGPTPLHRSSLLSPDLRAGAAFVLAALCAEGTSIVEHAELIDRGYVDLDGRLRDLGAQIERID